MNKVATPKFGIGASVLRVEDDRFISGTGQYTDDVHKEGALVGFMLRSPVAHARFTMEGLEDAREADGVKLVLTADDLEGINKIPCKAPVKQIDGTVCPVPEREVLCSSVVRHVGDAVAFIVADTLENAKAASEMIMVDYEDLPVTVGVEHALEGDASVIWSDLGSNKAFEIGRGDKDKTEQAFAAAAKTVSVKLVNNRVVCNYMEPRACIGEYDSGADRYTLTAGTQGGHGMRAIIAKDILGISEDRLRVITPDVGGGFGTKAFCYREYPLALVAAKQLGVPVRWAADRTDHFVTDAHGRDNVSFAELALDSTNKITGLKIKVLADMGAYLHQFGPAIPEVGISMSTGLYDVPALWVEAHGVYTNTVPVDAYRGAGRPEAAYLIERLMDKAAHEMGEDPAAFRHRNFIANDALPYKTPTGRTYDTGDFSAHLDKALAVADRDGFAEREKESKERGKYRGLGFASYVEACAFPTGEEATVELNEDGSATLYIGTQNNGQGHETAYGQVIAAHLGIDVSRVHLVQGDTDRVRKGGGTGGSRSIPLGVTSTNAASIDLVKQIKQIAGEELEAGIDDLELEEGHVRIVGTDRQMSLAQVAAKAPNKLMAREEVLQHECTYPNGTHVCEVEVDPETGTVHICNFVIVDDFGVTVNPLLLEGQVHGGAAQAISQALCESTVYDEDGQLLSASFLDYHVARADNLPSFSFQTHNVPSTTNALGIKGAGEAGTIGATPAVMNALQDALSRHAGVEWIDMPATPSRIWEAIRAARVS
ncbi:xanthine dehydrogenase family protein molybdopterin-binding subunit [Rhodobacteraceae bacterium RKSG542]|uniref:xanthine dehydrogenase family protein molybdopterin-binding subunit n=1 Tax=Pseudovibrio flavus TaxID=2529854 RepID=UPI0012BB5037|nr:xanthine dehydrogenase family protein molybdopterin-binding subunit [Pseudovibrio flavus]MTI19222.1 xanthine dehydrogenase family protein molybdopterin-binding subunit [Pseudovibrio flavus]